GAFLMPYLKTDNGMAKAQRAYDNMEPPEFYEDDLDECEICVYFRHGRCVAPGEIDDKGDCPSFKDD
ncbi:unnamed protein product, partial [marine sediment metagenome]